MESAGRRSGTGGRLILMPAKGIKRYFNLPGNIQNPGKYLLFKINRERQLALVTRPNAIRFNIPKRLVHLFKEIFMADVYHIKELVKKLPPNPIIIDVGANAGFFDILLLSKIPSAKIYSYEPLTANISEMRSTVEQNPFLKQNLSIFETAVSGAEKQTLDLFIEDSEGCQVAASSFPAFDERNSIKVSVPCISLTDIILNNNFSKIDLIKIDCEGSEYDIIYNTDISLIKRIRMMTVEVHDLDNDKNNITFLSGYLQSLGYTVNHLPINNFCHILEASSSNP